MKVFVSHIREEASLAIVLKEWIESSFVGQCEVFVSSDSDDIPAGSKWLDQIDQALEQASALIVLCSPASLSRPWINFETGCAWIKRVPIIPVCHSGAKKGSLPPPISMFQALELDQEEFVPNLLASLAKHLSFSKVPRIDERAMRQELNRALSHIEVPEKEAEEAKVSSDAFGEEIISVLTMISRWDYGESTVTELASSFNVSEERMKYYLDILQEQKLIDFSAALGRKTFYYLTKGGRKFLIEKGLL
jgi:predicted transcriptional regulator